MSSDKLEIHTLGFSNRPWEDTLQILRAHKIQRVVDIRTLPGSKHTPQYNQEHMEKALPEAGIEYLHLKSLGGLRKPKKEDVTNAGWKNASFRAYADHMQTPEFEAALEQLIKLAREKRSVMCCTEAVFWRCHRALVADALLARGITAKHIFTEKKAEPHRLTRFAKVEGTMVTYPGEPELV